MDLGKFKNFRVVSSPSEKKEKEVPDKTAEYKGKDFLKAVQGAEYREIPSRMQERDEVVKFIRRFTDRYDIKMDVSYERAGVMFRMYFHETLFVEFMKKEFALVLLQGDELSIITKGIEDWDYIIELVYYTHDVYLNGKKISLADD